MKKDLDMMVVLGGAGLTKMEPRVYVINTWDIVVRLFDVVVIVNFLLNLEILIHTLLLRPLLGFLHYLSIVLWNSTRFVVKISILPIHSFIHLSIPMVKITTDFLYASH